MPEVDEKVLVNSLWSFFLKFELHTAPVSSLTNASGSFFILIIFFDSISSIFFHNNSSLSFHDAVFQCNWLPSLEIS